MCDYAAVSAHECTFMLFRHETVDAPAVLALVLLQVFLRLGHLIAMCFLFCFNTLPSQLLILLLQLRLKELVFYLLVFLL